MGCFQAHDGIPFNEQCQRDWADQASEWVQIACKARARSGFSKHFHDFWDGLPRTKQRVIDEFASRNKGRQLNGPVAMGPVYNFPVDYARTLLGHPSVGYIDSRGFPSRMRAGNVSVLCQLLICHLIIIVGIATNTISICAPSCHDCLMGHICLLKVAHLALLW